jgi:hypothetical protein
MTSEDLKKQLDTDILRFLENIRNQTENDQIQTLRHLFDKYIHLNTADYVMDSYDLQRIVSSAKQNFSTNNMKIFLGERKVPVTSGDLPNLCVIEATVDHLSRIGCLKRLPKFDKREDRFPED